MKAFLDYFISSFTRCCAHGLARPCASHAYQWPHMFIYMLICYIEDDAYIFKRASLLSPAISLMRCRELYTQFSHCDCKMLGCAHALSGCALRLPRHFDADFNMRRYFLIFHTGARAAFLLSRQKHIITAVIFAMLLPLYGAEFRRFSCHHATPLSLFPRASRPFQPQCLPPTTSHRFFTARTTYRLHFIL